jgi:hypothetical protein
VVRKQPPSGRRQIAATDIYCQVTEQLGHLAGMSVAVATPFSGIRVPDVVWLPAGTCEGFDNSQRFRWCQTSVPRFYPIALLRTMSTIV